jgi:hypothetical protein
MTSPGKTEIHQALSSTSHPNRSWLNPRRSEAQALGVVCGCRDVSCGGVGKQCCGSYQHSDRGSINQLLGSAIHLNMHFHAIFLKGVWLLCMH